MNDPHVNWIKYKLIPRENTYFKECPPVEFNNEDFNVFLENDLLTCFYKKHFADSVEAKSFIAPFLRIWEIEAGLSYKRDDFHFSYDSIDVIDRNPTPGARNITAPPIEITCVSKLCSVGISGRLSYPQPSNQFSVTPDVEVLWLRYNQYRQGKEPLQSMAYFSKTFIVYTAACHEGLSKREKSDAKASRIYSISGQVLDTLSRLTSNQGDLATIRKVGGGVKIIPLTDRESIWLEECVLLLIRRLGEYAYDSNNLKQITMSDLPPLE